EVNNRTENPRDVQVKSMEQTVKHAEKYLGELCTLMAAYTRKTAKLRDKADLLVARLFDFSGTEGPELQIGLKNLAEDLAMVQDYRQAQVKNTVVIHASTCIIFYISVNRRPLSCLFSNYLCPTHLNAQKFSNSAQRRSRQVEDIVTDFQRQKLEDVKRVFTDFITVEMLFHAKALEVYTHTYHNLELFSGRIRMSESGHLDTPLSSHSSPLMSRYPSPPLTPSKGQSLRPMLVSTTSQNHWQQYSQYQETARRVSPNVLVTKVTEGLCLTTIVLSHRWIKTSGLLLI
uniref:Protein FAM92B-like n=1 Tax=Mastacembelus armatus TaxID=205130 RepID=A0A7N8WX81_9TELE